MKKFALSVAACTLLATSLAGCGDANNQAANDRAAYDMNYVNDYRGADQDYAMNRSNRGDRGEGPITDMLTVDDRTTRTERHDSTHNVDDRTGSSWAYNNARDVVDKDHYTNAERNANKERFQKYNGETGNHPGMVNNRGYMNGDNDENPYHVGHTDRYNSDNHHDLERTIDQAVTDMKAVSDTHVVVDDDQIVIAIKGNNISDSTKEEIKDEVEDYTNRTVYVTDDEEMFTNVRNIANDVQRAGGEMMDETRATFDDMVSDLGDMVERPFERSR
ncbi:YhcN/YlaJ family sporulation lipoprotein [Geomicrobium sp. JSM 1781026]